MFDVVSLGQNLNTLQVGGSWQQGSGYLEQGGVNKYLYSSSSIGAGDFTLNAKLSLATIGGTAATFDIAGQHFGFDAGAGQRLFTEGTVWGGPQYYGQARDYITANQPFNFSVMRRGVDISFAINGSAIVTKALNSGSLNDVGFRPWRNTMRLFDFSWTQDTTSIPVPTPSQFLAVNAGREVNAIEVGGSWQQGNGYIQQRGVNKYLYSSTSIGAGDFTLNAKLSLATLSGTAASFEIAGQHFGFDASGQRLFTEGSVWGGPQFYGQARDYITTNQPFDFLVTRRGVDISFAINGRTIVTKALSSGSLSNVGFRPWRNTMRLFDFAWSQNQAPPNPSNQLFAETTVFTGGTNGYASFRIPAIIKAGNGDLLAYSEGRVNSVNDEGNIDIVMRRSSNNGQTWQPLQVVADYGDFTAQNPGMVVDAQDRNKIVFIYNTAKVAEPDIVAGLGVREVWKKVSTDNGLTWSAAVNITASVHKPKAPTVNPAYNFTEDWRWQAVLPGHAIQLSNGRLIFGANYKLADNNSRSYAFYSDDHGDTWQTTNLNGLPGIGGETQLVQLTNGSVMMNSRPNAGDSPYRRVAISTDYGTTFSPFQVATSLPDPNVEGSIIRFTSGVKSRILFANPASTTDREQMTVRVSYDEGKTWTYSRVVKPGASAYSDLVIEADQKTIGLLYESDDYQFIRYAHFNIDWLTNGQDTIA
jgi:sialidase-1